VTHTELQAFLDGRVVIFEGGMGTMLQEAVPGTHALELLNVDHADEVLGIHRAYVPTADVICTNTFGGTSLKLAAVGLSERVKELNAAGVRLARQAARDGVLVAGDMGRGSSSPWVTCRSGKPTTRSTRRRRCWPRVESTSF